MSDAFSIGSIGGKWNILRAGGGNDGLEVPSLPLEITTAAGPIRMAVGSHGEARLLIPLGKGARLPSIEPGPALGVGLSTFTHRGRATTYLDLVCLSAELESVFAELVHELLRRIAQGTPVAESVQKTVDDFRALLVAQPNRAPEKSRVAGLIAELLMLNRLLDISCSAWRSWRGPAGDRHDFRARDTSLEIKASLHAGASVVTINGLDQLEPPAGGTLHLLHMILEPVGGGLLTVAGLGGQALEKADYPEGVSEMLHAVGCDDVEDSGWNRHAFRLEGEQLYTVTSGFPRISPSIFQAGEAPAGVVEATYKIDLGLAESCQASEVRYSELLRELGS